MSRYKDVRPDGVMRLRSRIGSFDFPIICCSFVAVVFRATKLQQNFHNPTINRYKSPLFHAVCNYINFSALFITACGSFITVYTPKILDYFPMQKREKMVARISVEGMVPVRVERWERVARRCWAMRSAGRALWRAVSSSVRVAEACCRAC